jgi:hypothetical protein
MLKILLSFLALFKKKAPTPPRYQQERRQHREDEEAFAAHAEDAW